MDIPKDWTLRLDDNLFFLYMVFLNFSIVPHDYAS